MTRAKNYSWWKALYLLRKGGRRDLTKVFNYVKELQQGREQTVSISPIESIACKMKSDGIRWKQGTQRLDSRKNIWGWAGWTTETAWGWRLGIPITRDLKRQIFSRLFNLGKIKMLFAVWTLESTIRGTLVLANLSLESVSADCGAPGWLKTSVRNGSGLASPTSECGTTNDVLQRSLPALLSYILHSVLLSSLLLHSFGPSSFLERKLEVEESLKGLWDSIQGWKPKSIEQPGVMNRPLIYLRINSGEKRKSWKIEQAKVRKCQK